MENVNHWMPQPVRSTVGRRLSGLQIAILRLVVRDGATTIACVLREVYGLEPHRKGRYSHGRDIVAYRRHRSALVAASRAMTRLVRRGLLRRLEPGVYAG
jgi:hypothetical protein